MNIESLPWMWIALGLIVVALLLFAYQGRAKIAGWWTSRSPSAPPASMVPVVPAPTIAAETLPPAAAPATPPVAAPASIDGATWPRTVTVNGHAILCNSPAELREYAIALKA